LEWHENGRDLAFNLTSARSPNDVYSLDVKTGKVERWTESETGGLDTSKFVEPELVKLKSFDGLEISGFSLRPGMRRSFPGPAPVVITIHGGPRASRGRSSSRGTIICSTNSASRSCIRNVFVAPTVTAKTFLQLDNGFKREDTVKDIGAFIRLAKRESRLDGGRVAVYGGSYGGYMVLASMTHFSDRLRCGIDVVGISHFVTFLNNTQDYRRDLRRAEYGDERDPRCVSSSKEFRRSTMSARSRSPSSSCRAKTTREYR